MSAKNSHDAHSRSPAKPKLSDAALVLLAQAASRDDGAMIPVPASLRARGSALRNTLRKLLEWNFAEELPVVDDQQVWRVDGDLGRRGLRITEAGLTAIGVPVLASAATNSLSDRGSPPIKSKRRSKRVNASQTSSANSAGLDDTNQAPKPTSARTAPKRSALIVLLQSAEGAGISEIASALGWLPHTTRAALTGLRQRGLSIIKSKRSDGLTVYRLEEARTDTLPGSQVGRPLPNGPVTVQL